MLICNLVLGLLVIRFISVFVGLLEFVELSKSLEGKRDEVSSVGSEISLEGLGDRSEGDSSSVGEDGVVVEGDSLLGEGGESVLGEVLSGLDLKGESDDLGSLLGLLDGDLLLDGFESNTDGSGVGDSGVSLGVQTGEVQGVSGEGGGLTFDQETVPVLGQLPEGVGGNLFGGESFPGGGFLHI